MKTYVVVLIRKHLSKVLSNEYPQHMFLWRNKKNSSTFGWKKKVSYLDLCFHLLILKWSRLVIMWCIELPKSPSTYVVPESPYQTLRMSCLRDLIRFLYSEILNFFPSTIQVRFGLGLNKKEKVAAVYAMHVMSFFRYMWTTKAQNSTISKWMQTLPLLHLECEFSILWNSFSQLHHKNKCMKKLITTKATVRRF